MTNNPKSNPVIYHDVVAERVVGGSFAGVVRVNANSNVAYGTGSAIACFRKQKMNTSSSTKAD